MNAEWNTEGEMIQNSDHHFVFAAVRRMILLQFIAPSPSIRSVAPLF